MVTHKFAMQTSRQAQAPLLCFDCEQILREDGEDWVLPRLAKYGGEFQLGKSLKAAQAAFSEPNLMAYALAGIPSIRVDALIHFAMGIFWKASIHSWMTQVKKPSISLGSYDEELRSFLLGTQDFPSQMALCLNVLPMPVKLISFHFPFETQARPEDRTFHLYVPGLNFTLFVGSKIPQEARMTCLNVKPHALLVYDSSDSIKQRFAVALGSAHKSRSVIEGGIQPRK
jgi:hypothetical protein